VASGEFRVAVPDGDVVAEEPRPLAASVRDEGLGVVEFQLEGVPEELRDLCLDLLGFGPGADETQEMIVGVARVFQAPVSGVRRCPFTGAELDEVVDSVCLGF